MSRDTPRCVVRQSAASRFAAGLPSALRGARNRARNWQAQERTFDSCFRVCILALGWVCRSSPFFKPAFCCAGSYPGSLQGWFTSFELVGPTRSVLRARGPVTSPVTMLVVLLCSHNPTQHETTQLKARFSSWALSLRPERSSREGEALRASASAGRFQADRAGRSMFAAAVRRLRLLELYLFCLFRFRRRL